MRDEPPSIYEAMVRMAQDFSMRLPLIASQGNFGSMDGDQPAAMRYTEARLALSASSLLDDIDKDTVNFMPNYDETTKEPEVLPASFPNVLVNGSGGIAVGMATNIPPHNLGEVVDACVAYIDNPDITVDELISIVPGPDFPTGGIILGHGGSRAALTTGKGSIVMRAKCSIEEIKKDKFAIVVTEIPYQVNKAEMITKMAELVRDKVIDGISDLRDESDRQGVRVVIELKRDAHAEVVLNQLYKYTPLQTNFPANMLALNGGRPMIMNLADIIKAFVAFREEVIHRRTVYELTKARDNAHVLVGLAIAVANLDEIITLIRKAPDPATAKEQLMAKAWPATDVEPLVILIDEPDRKVENGHYRLSETQAKAILPTSAPPTPTAPPPPLIATTDFVANPAPPTPNAPRDRSALRASARHKPALSPTIAPRQHLIATTVSAVRRRFLPATQPAPWQRQLGSPAGQTAPPAPQDSLRSISRGATQGKAIALILLPILLVASIYLRLTVMLPCHQLFTGRVRGGQEAMLTCGIGR